MAYYTTSRNMRIEVYYGTLQLVEVKTGEDDYW